MKGHKIQVHIVTLFLTLLLVSLLFITTFSYLRNSKSILAFSKGTASRAGNIIMEEILCFSEDNEHAVTLVSNLAKNVENISIDNKELINLLFTMFKVFPVFYAVAVGNEQGSFMEVSDLSMLKEERFIKGTTTAVPKGTKFLLRIIDRSEADPKDTWYYKNEEFETLYIQKMPLNFDPRVRPWYEGAKEHKNSLYWTNVFLYNATGAPIINVSKAIYDKEGKLLGAVGSILPLYKLDEYLRSLKIGKTGKALILDDNGKIVSPEIVDQRTKKTIDDIYANYSQKKRDAFTLKSNGVEYLAYIKLFPSNFKKDWILVVEAPLNDFFADLLFTQWEIALISIAILIIAALLVIYFSKRISAPIVSLAGEVDKLKKFEIEQEVHLHSKIHEINLLESAINSTKVMLRSFYRYVPKRIVSELMEQGKEIKLGGEKKELTIFFSDIENFTPITEALPADDLIPLLSEYYDLISKVILNNGGTIDKYIGDATMVFWGAPVAVKNHANLACKTALECQSVLKNLNENRQKEGKVPFPTRIGINTGFAFVGNIGTNRRMNYTCLGDSVNVAQRLEQLNKVYNTNIIIGQDVVKQLGDEFVIRPLDITSVKGKKEKLRIYELMESDQKELALEFTKGFEAFHSGQMVEAKKIFLLLAERFPQDYPTKLYLERVV